MPGSIQFFKRLTSANVPENKNLTNLIVEGKKLIRKRQKLIRIADKRADGWRVVDEYVSDELASGSEDEKRLKRAKDAANLKRRLSTQARQGPGKRIKTSLSQTNQQLFRDEPTFSSIYLLFLLFVCVLLIFCCFFYFGYFVCCLFFRVRMRSTHTSLYLVLRIFKW